MYYEIYVDTLFVLQFSLNLYLLGLVNRMLYYTASWRRIIGGAVLGAICSLIPFLFPGKMAYSMLCSFLLSVISMTIFTFRTMGMEQLLKVLEKILVMTLLLGGMLLFLIKILPHTWGSLGRIGGVIVLGAVSYALVGKLAIRPRTSENVCMVTMVGSLGRLQLEALIDTGNSLLEPISGAPVAVVQEEVFRQLFGDISPELFRAIPYCSVGKRNGILKGYLIKDMVIELQGVKKKCMGSYVAVCPELIPEKSNYKMILNPRMLEG